ncbi:ATP synthase subunit a [Neolewinella maritima]|uniref:ATP synthase subunit a n=1 Tax=Neolewinella maritima TaxID=1383882 RepID=A0ABN8F2U3_9BACT|nr:F0F1 ATP synthase subunit A [Neolewinella maritima]CAH1000066.1 ATP synthase subunit a [Neolewinella maritima]
MTLRARFLFLCVFCLSIGLAGQEPQDHGTTGDYGGEGDMTEVHMSCDGHAAEYDPAGVILHHIADANEFHLFGDFTIPLPVILYAPDHGFTVGFSNMFHHGQEAVDGYVMNHGRINRISGAPDELLEGHHHVECIRHEVFTSEEGKTADIYSARIDGEEYLLDAPSVGDGGLLGGGITSFYDFSITKNVFTMLLSAFLLILLWGAVAAKYKKNEGRAPSGIQSLMEPFFVFLRDEISIPMIGEKHYERFQPFIMTIFFFVLFCNLFGLIPIFPGSSNVTGNIGVTMALAVISAVVAYVHGNAHFWKHTLWMPGVPTAVKPLLTVVEVLGLVIKPFSLMVRLFANITAGHIIILSLISLIFIFGQNGESLVGAGAGAVVSIAFTMFMNCIELLVAFVQAFIFAILSASYIGAAVEDAHHHDELGHHGEEKVAEGGAMGGAVTGMHTPAN